MTRSETANNQITKKDLTTDPDEDPTTPMDKAPVEVATNNHDDEDTKSDKPASLTPKHEEGEAAKTTEEEIDEPTDELANESHTDYENAPDNQNDGKVTNTTIEEPHEVHDKWKVIPVTQCHMEYSTISKAIQHR